MCKFYDEMSKGHEMQREQTSKAADSFLLHISLTAAGFSVSDPQC